jgi:hypothetical protein
MACSGSFIMGSKCSGTPYFSFKLSLGVRGVGARILILPSFSCCSKYARWMLHSTIHYVYAVALTAGVAVICFWRAGPRVAHSFSFWIVCPTSATLMLSI